MQVRLLVTNDKSNVKKVVLRSDTTIGRSSDCNLRIASQEVSRQHCTILLNDAGVCIRDLDSSNGTYVNGERIEPNRDVPLFSESEIEIGNVRFRIQHEIPMQDEKSTAEVPNAAVAHGAINAESASAPPVAAPVAQPVQSPSGDPNVEETMRDLNVEETISEPADPAEAAALAAAETVNKSVEESDDDASDDLANAGPEDTIAFDFAGGSTEDGDESQDPATDVYNDSQVAALQTESPKPEETVSMNAGDFDFTEPAADQESAAAAEEPAQPKKSGLKSLFGFLGRKQDDEERLPKTEQIPTGGDAIDPEGTVPDDLRNLDDDLDEEEQTVAEQLPDDIDDEETLPDPVSETADDARVEESSEDGSAVDLFPEVDETAADEQADGADTNLNEFFKNLSQE